MASSSSTLCFNNIGINLFQGDEFQIPEWSNQQMVKKEKVSEQIENDFVCNVLTAAKQFFILGNLRYSLR